MEVQAVDVSTFEGQTIGSVRNGIIPGKNSSTQNVPSIHRTLQKPRY